MVTLDGGSEPIAGRVLHAIGVAFFALTLLWCGLALLAIASQSPRDGTYPLMGTGWSNGRFTVMSSRYVRTPVVALPDGMGPGDLRFGRWYDVRLSGTALTGGGLLDAGEATVVRERPSLAGFPWPGPMGRK